jgi:GNAT superfamily N-acetyltransferase
MPSYVKGKTMLIRELATREEFEALFPLIHQLNPMLEQADFSTRLTAMLANGYRAVVAEEAGEWFGVCGFWVGTRFWCGQYVDVDNVVVEERARGKGVGQQMIRWVEAEAARLGCGIAVLDSYVTYEDAHRFYKREGYEPLGYHFVKRLKEDAVITGMEPRSATA